jgi:hypothetical protein
MNSEVMGAIPVVLSSHIWAISVSYARHGCAKLWMYWQHRIYCSVINLQTWCAATGTINKIVLNFGCSNRHLMSCNMCPLFCLFLCFIQRTFVVLRDQIILLLLIKARTSKSKYPQSHEREREEPQIASSCRFFYNLAFFSWNVFTFGPLGNWAK